MLTPSVARNQIVDDLAVAMRRKLNLPRNIEKGNNWRGAPYTYMLQRLEEEVRELWEAIELDKDPGEVIEEAADVANFAAMIADKAKSELARVVCDKCLGRGMIARGC